MPCTPYFIKDKDGNVVGSAIVCSRGQRRKTCRSCGNRPASKLCDFPLAGAKDGKTCDMDLCASCAKHIPGKDLDYCPAHARAMEGR